MKDLETDSRRPVEYRDLQKEKNIEAQNEKNGFVKIHTRDKHGNKISYYFPKRDAIQVNGKWVEKIDLILDIFGEDDWNKEILKLVGAEDTKSVKFSDLMSQPEWIQRYRELRDGTAETALEIATKRYL